MIFTLTHDKKNPNCTNNILLTAYMIHFLPYIQKRAGVSYSAYKTIHHRFVELSLRGRNISRMPRELLHISHC